MSRFERDGRDFFQSRDRHFSRRQSRRRPPRTMLTPIPTTRTTTTQTTSKGIRRRRRSVARRAMRSSVDARFDEASSSSSSSSEESGVHVVSPGDSLYGVAVHYGVDPRDLIVRRRDFLPSFRRRRPFFPPRTPPIISSLRDDFERAGLLSAF